jgi:hypothetical protein
LPEGPVPKLKRPAWAVLSVVVIVAALLLTHPGRAVAHRFFSSLRIEKPETVTASFTTPSGSNRRVQDLVARMVADSLSVLREEPDRPAPDLRGAAQAAGFAPVLPSARADAPTLTVTGASTVSMTIERSRLTTILAEAGAPANVPRSVDGAVITMKTPRGVRAQYGHCPAPQDTTLRSQLVGRPRDTSGSRDCVIVTETPTPTTDPPPGLNTAELVRIALEVSGLSPDEAKQFQGAFDFRTSLGLAVPRFMRSFKPVAVHGATGMLMTSGWRRGPRYVLVWANKGMVYSLSGYGDPTDAVPLARSIG